MPSHPSSVNITQSNKLFMWDDMFSSESAYPSFHSPDNGSVSVHGMNGMH